MFRSINTIVTMPASGWIISSLPCVPSVLSRHGTSPMVPFSEVSKLTPSTEPICCEIAMSSEGTAEKMVMVSRLNADTMRCLIAFLHAIPPICFSYVNSVMCSTGGNKIDRVASMIPYEPVQSTTS
jgi:hypothetical protein